MFSGSLIQPLICLSHFLQIWPKPSHGQMRWLGFDEIVAVFPANWLTGLYKSISVMVLRFLFIKSVFCYVIHCFSWPPCVYVCLSCFGVPAFCFLFYFVVSVHSAFSLFTSCFIVLSGSLGLVSSFTFCLWLSAPVLMCFTSVQLPLPSLCVDISLCAPLCPCLIVV